MAKNKRIKQSTLRRESFLNASSALNIGSISTGILILISISNIEQKNIPMSYVCYIWMVAIIFNICSCIIIKAKDSISGTDGKAFYPDNIFFKETISKIILIFIPHLLTLFAFGVFIGYLTGNCETTFIVLIIALILAWLVPAMIINSYKAQK